jgi:hypothetical protein
MENLKVLQDQLEKELEDIYCRRVDIVAIKENKRGDIIALIDIKEKKTVVRKPITLTPQDLAV